jgi:hypothetical protein
MCRSFERPAAVGRPGWMALGLVAGVLFAGTVQAAEPALAAQAAPAAQAEAPKASPFAFPGDGAVFLITVKPDKTADFEMVMGKVKEALAKSEKPERKQQAAGWKVFRANEAPPNGVIYMLITDPVAKGTDYSLQTILTEGFGPTEGYNFAKALADSAVGQQLFNLKLVLDLK